MEQGLRALYDTAITEVEKISVILLLTGFVRNAATLAFNISAANLASGSTAEEAISAYGACSASPSSSTSHHSAAMS